MGTVVCVSCATQGGELGYGRLTLNQMNKLRSVYNRAGLLCLLALLTIIGQAKSLAVASAMETAVTATVTDAKTAGEAVLAVVATVIGAFILFKLIKRAANKV